MVVFEETAPLPRAARRTTAPRLARCLPSRLGASDFQRLDQKASAGWLGTTQPVIPRALAELSRVGVVGRGGKGPSTKYRLSPRVAWHGTAEACHAARRREGRDFAAEARAFVARLGVPGPAPTDED